MAKIGTVQVEVNPVANGAKWDAICQQIEDRVAEAVRRGIERGTAALHIPDQGGPYPS